MDASPDRHAPGRLDPSSRRSLSRPRAIRRLAALLLAAGVGLAGCSDGGDPTTPEGGGESGTPVGNSELAALSDWPDPGPSVPPTPVPGTTRTESLVVDSVSRVEEDGSRIWERNVEYVCTATEYDIADTPEQLVMFGGAPRDVLWPGALLQGRSHSDPQGNPDNALVALVIPERAPIQVSIPDLPTGDNQRVVQTVNQANVDAARGAMIGDASARNLFTPASDDFEVETYASEREFALRTGLSGRYLGFSANASGSVDRQASETTIAVRYIQKLYEVTVVQPPGPREFFTDAFTRARLEQEIAAGNLGPENQPLYVASVVYGRMMMFTMTAEASAEELTAIVNASYNGVVGGVEASLSTRQREIVSRSKVSITTYGGGRTGSQDMIRSGDWRDYFTQEVRLEEALPLSYTFRTLTGEEAGVQEATRYEQRKCQPVEDTPFLYPGGGAGQAVGSPVPTPFESHLADITGDGIDDLVLSHLSPSRNLTAVLPGTTSGEFGAAVVSDAGAAPTGGWANFNLLLGDVDGDGDADLVWSRAGPKAPAELNHVQVGLGEPGGELSFLPRQVHPARNWPSAYRPRLADLDGDGRMDLLWNTLARQNFVHVAMAAGEGAFDFGRVPLVLHPASGWSSYEPFVGDVDRDGDDDLIWNSVRLPQPNRLYVGALRDDRRWNLPSGNDHPTVCCWADYQRVVGDFDGDQQADILFWNPSSRAVHRAYSNGFDAWAHPAYQSLTEVPAGGGWRSYAGDVNGDGVDDLVLNRRVPANTVWVALGRPSRSFDAPSLQPPHPAGAEWSVVSDMLVGDVSGDGRADVVWVVPGSETRVFVGLGR